MAQKSGGKPRPPKEYGAYLEQKAREAGLDRAQLVRLTGLGDQTVWRNLSGQDQRSMLAANKIRDVIRARGVAVDPVPNETDDWKPGRAVAAVQPEDPMRRNLVNFREEAGLDLHEASSQTGISLETLRAYELGGQLVTGLHLIELAKAYGRPAEHFDQIVPPARPGPAPVRVKAMSSGNVASMPPEIQQRIRELEREAQALQQAINELQQKGKRRG